MHLVLLFIALLLVPQAEPGPSGDFDVVIRNGRVLDGTGNPWLYADVALKDDRIVAVGDLAGVEAGRIIDASGLYVAPGFIDVHSHAASGLETEELSAAQPLLAQGITTVFVNPDGGGSVDILGQRNRLLEHGLGVNVGQMVPHGSVRRAVLGSEDIAPSKRELQEMSELVRAAMNHGAFGLSSGLFYAPGSYAETEELIELSKEVKPFGGVYTSHIRDEGDYSVGLLAAVEEVIEIAAAAEIPGIVSHIKALGPPVWGFSQAIVHRIERAREQGIEVWADQYPYDASATGLGPALLPRWAQAGGSNALMERLSDPETREQIEQAVAENLERRGGAERIQFRYFSSDASIEGRLLSEVAEERGEDPIETTLYIVEQGGAGIVSFNMHEEDVATLMRQPWTMTSSDGGLVEIGEGVPHPRNYGTYPRKLRRYVLEEGVLPLSDAIRSMTGLPATVFRLQKRGLIKPGMVADVVVFDLEELIDNATFEEPHQLSEGMQYVFVNGELAIDEGEFTDVLSGRILRLNEAVSPEAEAAQP